MNEFITAKEARSKSIGVKYNTELKDLLKNTMKDINEKILKHVEIGETELYYKNENIDDLMFKFVLSYLGRLGYHVSMKEYGIIKINWFYVL